MRADRRTGQRRLPVVRRVQGKRSGEYPTTARIASNLRRLVRWSQKSEVCHLRRRLFSGRDREKGLPVLWSRVIRRPSVSEKDRGYGVRRLFLTKGLPAERGDPGNRLVLLLEDESL